MWVTGLPVDFVTFLTENTPTLGDLLKLENAFAKQDDEWYYNHAE
mgnify:CR=1 FL=1